MLDCFDCQKQEGLSESCPQVPREDSMLLQYIVGEKCENKPDAKQMKNYRRQAYLVYHVSELLRWEIL